MALKTSEAGAKAGPGDLRRGDPGLDSLPAPETQANRRARRVAAWALLHPDKRHNRGSLARRIYKRRRHDLVQVSVEPESRIEGLNRILSEQEAADYAVWLSAEYGWPIVDECGPRAATPGAEPARHLAEPTVHVVERQDGSWLVGAAPRPWGAKPPMIFLGRGAADRYADGLARRYGDWKGPLRIMVAAHG